MAIYSTVRAEIRYDWKFVLSKIKYDWVFILLKRVKLGTPRDLFPRKCSNKVRLVIYSIGKAKIRYGWEVIPL